MFYILLTRYKGIWYPQFGDHDRETVEQERQDIMFSPDYAEVLLARDTKIISTKTARQSLIDKAVAALNTP